VLRDIIREHKCGLAAALPQLSVESAKLTAFRGVDAPKPDALPVDFDRVPVNHTAIV
jgi:hypothetical protein